MNISTTEYELLVFKKNPKNYILRTQFLNWVSENCCKKLHCPFLFQSVEGTLKSPGRANQGRGRAPG